MGDPLALALGRWSVGYSSAVEARSRATKKEARSEEWIVVRRLVVVEPAYTSSIASPQSLFESLGRRKLYGRSGKHNRHWRN